MPSPLEPLFDLVQTVGANQAIHLPDSVMRALQLKPGDRVRFSIGSDGGVRLDNPAATRAAPGEGLAALRSIAAEFAAHAGASGAGNLAGGPLLASLLGGAASGSVLAPKRKTDSAAGGIDGEPEPVPGLQSK